MQNEVEIIDQNAYVVVTIDGNYRVITPILNKKITPLFGELFIILVTLDFYK